MRNVFKGFQVSQLAVPKIHAAKINQSFQAMHTPRRPPAPTIPKSAPRPGRNPGIRRGFDV